MDTMAKGGIAALTDKLLPVLLVVSILLAFVVGMLWQRVASLEGGGTRTTTTAGTGNAGDTAPEPPPTGKLSEDQAAKVPQVTSADWVRGSRDAQVFLIEYSDYECPFCKQFHPTGQQVVDEYGGQVAWVLRDFPLEFIHPNARPAAEAAECVGELGGNDAFWTFSDAAFEGSPASLKDLTSLATAAGVAAGAFDDCVVSGRTADLVQADYDGGTAAGITGTPGNFIVNDKGEAWLVPGAVPFETLKATIDEALAS